MTTRMQEPGHQPAAVARAAHEQARALLGRGASRGELLAHLARAGEQASGPGSVVSILVLDEAGLLRNGASPGLPADYLHAIDGLKPDPLVGTCAAAAATGRQVTTPDFRADHKWAELRHLPLALGFAGAWSMPILSSDGRVLGTFGTYFRECREPTPQEREAVSVLASAAAEVLGT
ncbi:MAG TPA: GAF domain-containing protein [Usitatibacter sp.]|nr:GAF domain-containing protein [Usitatibacter sp.]